MHHIPNVQDYIDQRNTIFVEYRQARNTFSRKSILKYDYPEEYVVFKARFAHWLELLEAVEELAQQKCHAEGLKLRGTCSPVAYIGKR